MKLRDYLFGLLFLILLTLNFNLSAQGKVKSNNTNSDLKVSPKLVVGIVVDQMRYDYLTRYYSHFGKDGFKRLLSNGFNCKNNHVNFAPTHTAPGHTAIHTGATPSVNGIIGNNWYDKYLGKDVYCTSDEKYSSVGTTASSGKMSPHRLVVTTLADEVRLHTQMRGKTIAIALKDRGAILSGGHTANAAYWFHGSNEGKWITSSFYMDELPKWVNNFNNSGLVKSYKKAWVPLKNISTYKNSGTDGNDYEGVFKGEKNTSFPHNTPNLLDKNNHFGLIKKTPFGNSLTTDFAIEAIKNEYLGKDQITDFLAISYSSTDYVGHKFGVNSKEVQDTYLRLDQDLERLFKVLDQSVGKGEYTLFLTSDHGAVDAPAYLQDNHIPAGYIFDSSFKDKLAEFLNYTYGTEDIIKNYSNYQVFLDDKIIKNLDLDIEKVECEVAKQFLSYDFVERVYTAHQMWNNDYASGIPYIMQNGYNQKRSGDVLIVTKPGYIDDYAIKGSTHGSAQIYDTHTPLLFYGKGIKQGSTVGRTEIIDIASTISVLLGIPFPNGAQGQPIKAVLE